MGLTFINPFFLFGLAAGILPILIHRLVQRKAIPRAFSAVRLLVQSQRMMVRSQRLKHLVLLCLRILAVISFIFMMARPVLTSHGILASGRGGNRVVIIDNSLSMSYRQDEGERYDLAKRAAGEVIEGMKGQVLIIPTAPVPNTPSMDETMDWVTPEEALKKISSIPLSFGRGDPVSALNTAFRKLKDSKMDKEILVISDLTRGDWEGFNLARLGIVPSDSRVTFLRMGGQDRDPNLAIKRVELAGGEAVVGVAGRLEVTVWNLSDDSQSTLVQLHISGVKVDQKSMELKAGEEGKAYFDLFLDKPGWVNGEVRLSEGRLSLDDVFFFALKVREKVRVLVVDGDPRASPRASESYYLVNALNPGGSERSPFLVRGVREEELVDMDLKPFEAVFMANVARPQTSRLHSFMASSKPVFIFLGDQVVSEEYNSFPLFPWRIREVVEAEPQRPQGIGQVDDRREALKPFSASGGESLKKASFRRYFKVEGSRRSLIALEDGNSLLVEADLGKSKIFLFSSTADLDWNDLPLKAAYLPLVQGLVKEALGFSNHPLATGMRFGEPFEEDARPTQLVGPPGGPGIYQFHLQQGEVRRGVNTPLEESDLGKVTDQEVRKRFGTMDVKVVEYKEGTLSAIRAKKKEIWPYVLAFLLLVLAVEMGVANGIPRASRQHTL